MKKYNYTNYMKIEAEEGHYLTSYNDEQDIRMFFSSRICICPIEKSDNIREITEEENNNYIKLQEEALNGKDR